MVGFMSVLIIMPTVAYAAEGSVACNGSKHTLYGKVNGFEEKSHLPSVGWRYTTVYELTQSNASGVAIVQIGTAQYTASTGSYNSAVAVGTRDSLGLQHSPMYREFITSR